MSTKGSETVVEYYEVLNWDYQKLIKSELEWLLLEFIINKYWCKIKEFW